MSSGAGKYFCGTCLAEHSFYGAFEGNALDEMGRYTLGLSFIVVGYLRAFLFKPVCVECGSRLNWHAQEFLLRGRTGTAQRSDFQKKSTRLVKSVPVTAMGSDPSIEGLGYQFDVSQPYEEEKNRDTEALNIDWGFASAKLSDAGGKLVGKLVFDPAYILRSIFSNHNETLIAHHDAYGGRSQWVSIYRPISFCIFPWRLPKWREIARREVQGTSYRNVFEFKLLQSKNLVVFASTTDVLVIDVNTPRASVVIDLKGILHNRVENLWINDIHIARSGTGIIMSGTQYFSEEHQKSILAIVNFNSKSLEIHSYDRNGVLKVLDDCGDILLLQLAKELHLFDSMSWSSMVKIPFEEDIAAARITIDRKHIVVRLHQNVPDTSDLGAVENMPKVKVSYTIYEIADNRAVVQ